MSQIKITDFGTATSVIVTGAPIVRQMNGVTHVVLSESRPCAFRAGNWDQAPIEHIVTLRLVIPNDAVDAICRAIMSGDHDETQADEPRADNVVSFRH